MSYSKLKAGDPVALLNYGSPAPRGIVQEVVREEAIRVRVRMGPAWTHTAYADDVLRLRLSDEDRAKVRASVFGALA